MDRQSWTIACLAYCLGLFSTGIFGTPNPHPSWQQWTVVAIGVGLSTLLAATFIPRIWARGPRRKTWLVVGSIALLAAVYFQLRIPRPDRHDISQLLKAGNPSGQMVAVSGKLLSPGKSTGRGRLQFWLKSERVKAENSDGTKEVSGKLYLTLPWKQGRYLVPGQKIKVTGLLYEPRPASNPGAFNFKNYLARQGTFAGLKGHRVVFFGAKPPWSLYQLRKQILDAQVQGLGYPKGLLISSIVLGQKSVNLPEQLQESFRKAGLAHVLAASGFQISLILGTTIKLTRNFSKRSQFAFALSILVFYVGMTGFQPSVMRAGVMGVGGLVALLTNRKVIPLGSLLLSATILLLIHPIWIWDLGFQLSFLATFGLIVTLPSLGRKLDWLPTGIAYLIAIPLAASIWTIPLSIYVFNTISVYSIPANIIASPLVIAVSLVGTVSAAAALIFPPLGSLTAWIITYPTHLLVETVSLFNRLPISSLTVGKISLGILVSIYALMIFIWLNKEWQRRWWMVGLFMVALVVLPIACQRLNLVQVTVLATRQSPILVIQERGKITLIGSSTSETTHYTILPFLARQGIAELDCVFALDSNSKGWTQLRRTLPIKQFLSVSDRSSTHCQAVESMDADPPVLQLTVQQQQWIVLGKEASPADLPLQRFNSTPEALVWPGKRLQQAWLEEISPHVAIAVSSSVDSTTRQQLEQRQIPLYWTGRDGAIQWTPQQGFRKALEGIEPDLS